MPKKPVPPDALVTASNVDLSNCDREVVHLPDMIQPHGVILVLRPSDFTILRGSENIGTFFGKNVEDLASKGLPALFGCEQASKMQAAIVGAGDRLGRGPLQILHDVRLDASPESFDVIAHRAGDVLILEVERVSRGRLRQTTNYADLTACISRLRCATSTQDFLDQAVAQVRAFTGFDRVMAYRFMEDGSGHVVAEAMSADLNPYLGQHFPAVDIPAPARRLLSLSWLRHLPNVDYTPVRLLPASEEPVDLSRALLRHVSVMYSRYLKNMGVHATLVMPLMKAGRLWGLISCMHHAGPLHVPSETRTATEVLAQMVPLLMAEQEDRDTADYRRRMTDAIAGLARQMAQQIDLYLGLDSGACSLLGWLDATGAAVVTKNRIVTFGEAPTRAQVADIARWLAAEMVSDSVFATDRLTQVYPPAGEFQATASGLLTLRALAGGSDFVIWFRPEFPLTVDWAGNPNKPVYLDVINGEARLTPRVSFDLWKETVRGRCEPWLDCEIEAAESLRRVIAEVALARMNEELKRSNNELDSFAYMASHDLKEPLRGISNFAEFLKRSAAAKLTTEEQGRIETIIRLTRRMNDLTDALLKYSRVGQSELHLKTVDLNALLVETLDSLQPRLSEAGVKVHVPRPLPTIASDRIWIGEILSNLITNAIKYTDRAPGDRWVTVTWEVDAGQIVVAVRDNGIGIAPQHLETIFDIFRRLHARDEYAGGSGAGLTIARRTVERLGGRLWVESEGLGKGSTFFFSVGRPVIESVQA